VKGHDGIKAEVEFATEQQCQDLCEKTTGCTAFVMATALPGACFLRSSIKVSDCLQSEIYDLYAHGIPPPLATKDTVLV